MRRRRVAVGLALGLALVLAGAGCHRDRPARPGPDAATAGPDPGRPVAAVPATTRPFCTPSSVRAAVERFLAAMAEGRVTDLDAFFVPAPRFRWYANSVPPGVRVGDRASDRGGLLAHLRRRQASHERMRLTWMRMAGPEVAYGLGHFAIRLRRTADDLPGGPQPLAGKGAVDCDDGHRLVVLSTGRPF